MTKVLIVSVTARGSMSATGQLIDTLFARLEPIETLSLHSGHPSANELHPQILFRRCHLYSIYKAVRAFQPDVIYVRPTLKPLTLNLFASVVIIMLSPKVVIHVMDDEANDRTNGGFFKRRFFSLYLNWLTQRAGKIFTISPGMSDAFFERYGCDSQPLSNIPLGNPPTEYRRAPQSSEVRVGYFGSLDFRMNQQCVEELCKALEVINNGEMLVSLDIFTRPIYKQWADKNLQFQHTKVELYVPSELYFETLQNYDVLLIAYNFDPITLEYCKYSIANKLADYLRVGVPILIVGPEAIETVAHCKRNGIGTTLSNGYSTLERDVADYVHRLISGEVIGRGMWERHWRALRFDDAQAHWLAAFR